MTHRQQLAWATSHTHAKPRRFVVRRVWRDKNPIHVAHACVCMHCGQRKGAHRAVSPSHRQDRCTTLNLLRSDNTCSTSPPRATHTASPASRRITSRRHRSRHRGHLRQSRCRLPSHDRRRPTRRRPSDLRHGRHLPWQRRASCRPPCRLRSPSHRRHRDSAASADDACHDASVLIAA